MTRNEPHQRYPVWYVFEPRKDNDDSDRKRVKNRRIDDQTEMESIKNKNTHLQTHKDELEARFAPLTNEYNKL